VSGRSFSRVQGAIGQAGKLSHLEHCQEKSDRFSVHSYLVTGCRLGDGYTLDGFTAKGRAELPEARTSRRVTQLGVM
jgi:hypothetical protein